MNRWLVGWMSIEVISECCGRGGEERRFGGVQFSLEGVWLGWVGLVGSLVVVF